MLKITHVDINLLNSYSLQPMANSQGLGYPLVSSEGFGADLLAFKPGTSTEIHTHPGDHILYVLNGSGKLLYDQMYYDLASYTCYFVHGAVPHAIYATSELILLSIANQHIPVDSNERSLLVK